MSGHFEMYVISIEIDPDGGTMFAGVIAGLGDVLIGKCEGHLWVDDRPVLELHINGEGLIETTERRGVRILSSSESVPRNLVAEPWRCRVVGCFEEGNTARRACACLERSISEFVNWKDAGKALQLLRDADAIIEALPTESLSERRVKTRLADAVFALRQLYVPVGAVGAQDKVDASEAEKKAGDDTADDQERGTQGLK